jgi:drug/metabolite transporter (DMT)-like permease
MMLSDNARAAAYMSLAMVAFVVNDTAMKLVTQDLPMFQTLFLRGLITCALLAALASVQGGIQIRIRGRDRMFIGLRTLGDIGATLTFLTALINMPLANLTALVQSVPLAVTLAGALFLRQPVGWRRLLAILVGFAGVLLIVRPGAEGFDRYSLIALVSVGFVVLRDLSTRQVSGAVRSASLSFVSALVITTMGAIGTSFETWAPVGAGDMVRISVSAVGVVGGYMFVVLAMRTGDVAVVAPFRYSSLVWALIVGYVVFGDFPRPLTLVGAAIVVGTGLFTFYRERRLAQG